MQNNARPPITSHALDTATGKPAQGLPLKLEQLRGEGGENWVTVGSSETNDDGRAPSLVAPGSVLERATYRVIFDTESYFRSTGAPCFYPEVTVVFRVDEPSQHYHIPLLISPFGYSTYRGS
ncbi:unnamed protein product [Ascophyllum nodosum]